MKISLNWLKAYVDFSLDSSTVATLLTQRGLEVSAIHSTIKGGLSGLIIGEIVSCLPHPNADRLKKTLVDIGGEHPLSIVCGAPNVSVGLKVVIAPVGTTIYSYPDQIPFPIKKIKIRGEWSEGMICAENEIGLGSNHEGILIVNPSESAGTSAKDYFKERLDEILEIDITPNRADACSHLGVARELKAILHLPIVLPSIDEFRSTPTTFPLKINKIDAHLSPRYCGLLLNNAVIQPSPEWLRLEHIDVRSINNIVDVTNFILHDLGQPLHAFDYDAIVGGEISVKQLSPGTLFVGLDGIERKLAGHELMICDAEGPIAMAGILGGLRTKIKDTTQRIFIEGAYFDPAVIRDAVQYHNLHTDASFRFERGVDPNLALYALKRAALLLKQLIPAPIAYELIECFPTQFPHFTIPLAYEKVAKCLGFSIHPKTIKQIITDLEIDIEEETHEGFTAKVPPYRVDVTREIDLIEEIARIYGYDNFPAATHLATTYLASSNEIDRAHAIEQDICKLLAANSYCEIWNNSLIKGDYINNTLPHQEIIPLLNPLSTSTNILRPTLLFSGLEVIASNLAYRQYDLKLFEFGKIYTQNDHQYREEKKLSIWLTGCIEHKNWVRQLGTVSLYNLKSIIEELTKKLGILTLSYRKKEHPCYEQAAEGSYHNTIVTTFGQLHASILAEFSIAQPVFFADIDWEKLLKLRKLHKVYQPIARVPTVTRDLSVVVDQAIVFQEVQNLVIQQNFLEIQGMTLVDVYTGPPLPEGKKAYALSFTLQDKTKTLNDQRIDQIMHQLMQTFERDLHAIIRR